MEGLKANISEIEFRKIVIEFALLQYGKLYEHGMNGRDSFDCAGLVWYIYNEIFNINLYKSGFGLSTTTKIMTCKYGKLTVFDEGIITGKLKHIRKGDVLFFHRQSLRDKMPTVNNKYPGHCGIYLGDRKFLHASMPKSKVIISDFTKNEYWLNVLVGNKDIIGNFLKEDNGSHIKKLEL